MNVFLRQFRIDLLEPRRLFAGGEIRGSVFADYDSDALRDPGEPGISNWQVYLDANDNGTRDTGELLASTDASGEYVFSSLAPGEYVVRQILKPGWIQTSPAAAPALVPAPAPVLVDDPRELTPNDTSYGSQYAHGLMQNDLAWNTTLGSSDIVIAVVDDGVDWQHADLEDNIWINPGEIAGNGIDDDGNGFIDDVRGWDVIDNDNNPAPDFPLLDPHGTHVAGVAAAATNNATGVAGVAGGAKIMPVRVLDRSKPYNAATLAAALNYAVDNGAKIVVISLNTDGFINTSVYLAALQNLHDQGVLLFNSAGNSNVANPPRQAFEQALIVASTDSNDVKGVSSNYGWGVDIAAPGVSILSTIPGNLYDYQTGTSMAAPAAAGAAALIWSAHPNWTRDQVAAALVGGADRIDQLNIGYADMLGGGRVNSHRAISQPIAPPKFKLHPILGLPEEGQSTAVAPDEFTLDLANVFDASSVNNLDHWQLAGDGIDGIFDTPDDVIIPLQLLTDYGVGTNRLRFDIPGALPADRYRFAAVSGITALRDPFGQPLDGNRDGNGGDSFSRIFSVDSITIGQHVSVIDSQTTYADFGVREIAPPKVNSAVFEYQAVHGLVVSFTKPLDAPLTTDDLVVQNLTTLETIDPAHLLIEPLGGGFTRVRFPGLPDARLGDGRYLLTIKSSSVADQFGNALDGNEDGYAGGDYRLSFFFLNGDANRDAVVDSLDFNTLIANYGKQTGLFSNADFNNDLRVNTQDFNILAGVFGETLPVVASLFGAGLEEMI